MLNILEKYEQIRQEMDFASTDAARHGKTIIQVGSATCENAAGAVDVKNEFLKLIQTSGKQDIIVKQTGCTGRCAQEPIVGIFAPNKIAVKYEKVTPEKVADIFQKHIVDGTPVSNYMLDKTTDKLYSHVVTFFASAHPVNSNSWVDIFYDIMRSKGLDPETIRVKDTGSVGLTAKLQKSEGGYMMFFPENVIYHFRDAEDIEKIIESHIGNDTIADEFVSHTDYLIEEYFKFYGDVSFFNKQSRITLRNCGIIDPESIEDYVHAHGFKALSMVLQNMEPTDIVDEMLKSGLRGRGGGGFPVGSKWRNTRNYRQDPIKYVICNADEGDPGAFMDRSALEGDPFSIIEGMIIGAYAVEACKGFFYIRAEYPLAIERIQNAIDISRKHGFLGENILGSGFSFDLEIRLGAGAFVCGEETALIHSIEGLRGQPRMRPPYPSHTGLWGHPTCINNVETWANVPAIILYGSDWFSNIGTEGSKGTKVFALAGKVNNTGLIEVPMGTTLREVIYEIGGGVADGKELKAIQTGGPSGGCIPIDKLDTPIDYETLKAIGSMMGSGGMIVLDETDCMVNTAKFFLEFTKDESCGKCLPCREGTVRMLEILEKITTGKAVMEDIDKLERLCNLIKKTSLCGLGQTAPNPVLSALKNFREEFEIHIKEQRCPTQKCQELIRYLILEDKCTGCTLCARRCPVNCISGARKQLHTIVQEDCIKCGECYNVCQFDAIIKN